MRRLPLALAIAACLAGGLGPSLCTAAPAATVSNTAQDSLKSLQHLETVSYQVATSFFLHSVLKRDPQHLKKAQAHIASGETLVQKLRNPAITAKWAAFRQSIASARFTAEGEPEIRSLIAIDATLASLIQAMRTQRAEQRVAANVGTDRMADMLYDQHVLMQTMTTAYLLKSVDSFGGSIVQSSAPQVEIDTLATQFQSQLNQLSRHYARNAEVAAALRDVTTKWTFIRDSFINYNEKNVPFIVGRYNEQITEKLLLAYGKLK